MKNELDTDLLPPTTALLAPSSRPDKLLVPSGPKGWWFYSKVASFWFGYSVLAALGSVVWPSQIESIVGSERKEEYNGIVPAFGAGVSLVITPIAGILSDRARTKIGRRKIFIITGTLIGALFLSMMGYFESGQGNLWVFVAFTVGYQLGTNWAAGPYTGLIPDLVHPTQLGTASGYNGLAQVFGYLVGLTGAGLLTSRTNYFPVYIYVGSIFVAFSLPTIFGVKENSTAYESKRPLSVRGFMASFYLSPRLYKSFYWVIATRGMEQMGYYSVIPFFQFFLQDVFDLDDPEFWSSVLFSCVVTASVPSSIIAGRLSDRYGKKLFIYISTGLMTVMMGALIVIAFYPQLYVLLAAGAVFGIGYGAFLAVDWALALAVLPEGADTAKDMGIWHIALVLPQILAPMISGFVLTELKHKGFELAYAVVFAIGCGWFLLATIFITPVKVPVRDD